MAQTLPLYMMQNVLLPVSLTAKLDQLVRDFWWGFKEDTGRHLYLKTWDTICSPKQVGGLGFRRFRDYNMALLTKMNWQMYVEPHKPWVKLIKAKYLRGRKLLDLEKSPIGAFWTWREMWECRRILRKGLSVKINRNSTAQIWTNPWIPGIPDFRLQPHSSTVQPQQLVRELIDQELGTWNYSLICNMFPTEVAREIFKIQIPQ